MLQNVKHWQQTVNTTTTQLSPVKHNDSKVFTLVSNGGLGLCQLSPVVSVYKNGSTSTSNFYCTCLSSTIQPFSLEFFSAWQWKVYDQNPYTRVNLLQAMVLAFCDIGVECFQGWIQHTRGFLLRCFVVLCWQYWVVMVTVILWCNSTAVIGLVFHYPCFPGNALVPTTACQWHSMDYVNHYIR